MHSPQSLRLIAPAFRAALIISALSCVSPHALTADKKPSPKPLTRMEGTTDLETSTAMSADGPLVRISGSLVSRYVAFAGVADNTTYDLREFRSVPKVEHPTRIAFTAGEQPAPPRNLRIVGGLVHGTIPLEWDWTMTHAFGGAAFYTVASGSQILEGARIHNMHDGWRPRETPSFAFRAYPNNASFLMRACYVTGVRDDCVENDEFMPGDIEDSLFDGVHTFLSEQNEGFNGVRTFKLPTIAPDEDPEIRITRCFVRLAITCGGKSPVGTWFKFHGYDSRSHRLVVRDSVFAVDLPAPAKWDRLNFPKEATFQGTNILLWFGTPGTYGGKVPGGVSLIEGPAAREKWHQVRNEWLRSHGYEPCSPDEWDPMKAKVAASTKRSGYLATDSGSAPQSRRP